VTRALAVFAALMLAAAAAAAEAPRYVSVTGEGEVETTPDTAEIGTGVTARARSAREALDATSAGMRRLMESLKKEGIAAADIRTDNINLSPWYEPAAGGQPRRIAGYQATNQVAARIRDISHLGRVLDAVVSAGANRVNGVRFGVAEPEALMNEAQGRGRCPPPGRTLCRERGCEAGRGARHRGTGRPHAAAATDGGGGGARGIRAGLARNAKDHGVDHNALRSGIGIAGRGNQGLTRRPQCGDSSTYGFRCGDDISKP
jgi:hypothetical protein